MSEPHTETSSRPCPKCQKPLEEGIRFCPHCGPPLTDTSATRADSQPTVGRRPATPELALPVVVGNRYRLEELRGGGGMAKVYRGTDMTLEREVAVELINPDLRNETEFDTRFQREARIASQLADPHIVVVHDFGIDPTHGPYLVMEYLQGQSLRERLIASGPLPLKAGLQLAGQLILALIHAHGKNIVHRDIKPDNIFLLNQSGVRLHTRVLDFGIARIYKEARSEPITHAGAVLGTPRYMSPEQLAGQPVDARSDLYSAALVIFEALTGQVPFPGGKRLCELCPEASPGLQELLEQCLKPAATERPPTAVEVYLRLQELGKASGILLLPPGAMDRLVARRKANEPTEVYTPKPNSGKIRRRVLVALGAIIAILALLALGRWIYNLMSGPVEPSGPESVLGVKIGDGRAEVEGQLRMLTGVEVGNPWNKPKVLSKIGAALKPEDLGLAAGELPHLITRFSDTEGSTVVIFHEDKVVAVVSNERIAGTGRGVKVGDAVGKIYRLYPEGGESKDEKLEDGSHVEVRRYDERGVAFEIRRAQVSGVAIFPPK